MSDLISNIDVSLSKGATWTKTFTIKHNGTLYDLTGMTVSLLAQGIAAGACTLSNQTTNPGEVTFEFATATYTATTGKRLIELKVLHAVGKSVIVARGYLTVEDSLL